MLRPEIPVSPAQPDTAGAEPTTPCVAAPGPTPTAGQGHTLTIHVIGTPVAQGSKVANRFGHGVRDANAKTLKPWRTEVAGCVEQTMRETGWATLDEPVEVVITFYHPRPLGHYGTGRNSKLLKPSAPRWKATAPDIDKLTRAILDALTTSRAIRDDARVARLVVEDRFGDAAIGARISITPLTDSVPAPTSLGAGTELTPGAGTQGEGSRRRDTTTTTTGALF